MSKSRKKALDLLEKTQTASVEESLKYHSQYWESFHLYNHDIPGTISIFFLKRILEQYEEKESSEDLIKKFERLENSFFGTLNVSFIEEYKNKTTVRYSGSLIHEKSLYKLLKPTISLTRFLGEFFDLLREAKHFFLMDVEGNKRPHVRDMVYISKVFDLVYVYILGFPTERIEYFRINPFLSSTEERISYKRALGRLKVKKVYNLCKTTENFYLNLRDFLVKNSTSDVDHFMNKYDQRDNPMDMIIREDVDPKYIHKLWDLFKKKHGEAIYKVITNIHGQKLKNFIQLSVNRLESAKIKTEFDSLIMFYLCRVWFEKISFVDNWQQEYSVMHEKTRNQGLIAERFLSNKPFFVRYAPGVWCLGHDMKFWVGNILEAVYKYKKILVEMSERNKVRFEIKNSISYKSVDLKTFF